MSPASWRASPAYQRELPWSLRAQATAAPRNERPPRDHACPVVDPSPRRRPRRTRQADRSRRARSRARRVDGRAERPRRARRPAESGSTARPSKGTVAVAYVRLGEISRTRPYWSKPQSRSLARSACCGATGSGRTEHDRVERQPFPPRGRHLAPPGAVGMAGLDPDRAWIGRKQVVPDVEASARDDAPLRLHDLDGRAGSCIASRASFSVSTRRRVCPRGRRARRGERSACRRARARPRACSSAGRTGCTLPWPT